LPEQNSASQKNHGDSTLKPQLFSLLAAGITLGQPFVIKNKPGAGGGPHRRFFVNMSTASGNTMLITSIGMATNKPLYIKLNHDPVKAFAPVNLMAVVPNVRTRFATIGAESDGSTPDDLAAHLARETARRTQRIAERSIKLD
jgi:tripartite-type tricarboxylate transporter receptor subunit TctC